MWTAYTGPEGPPGAIGRVIRVTPAFNYPASGSRLSAHTGAGRLHRVCAILFICRHSTFERPRDLLVMVDEAAGPPPPAAAPPWKVSLPCPLTLTCRMQNGRAPRPAAPRRAAKHRSSRRFAGRRKQLIGLTAALAAAAGTTAVGLTSSATGPSVASSTGLSPSQASALTAARIDRRDLGSRDASRIDLDLGDPQGQGRPGRQAARRATGRERDADPAPVPGAGRGQGGRRQEGRSQGAGARRGEGCRDREGQGRAEGRAADHRLPPDRPLQPGRRPLGAQPHRPRLRRSDGYAGALGDGRRGHPGRLGRRLRSPGQGPARRRHGHVVQPHVRVRRLGRRAPSRPVPRSARSA